MSPEEQKLSEAERIATDVAKYANTLLPEGDSIACVVVCLQSEAAANVAVIGARIRTQKTLMDLLGHGMTCALNGRFWTNEDRP